MNYRCLSIAGFDGSGGAGMQADLKTFSALGCYGMTVLTALPIQNTCGVKKCYDIPVQAIIEQLETIFEDILPDSIKIGMLFSSDIIQAVADFLKQEAKQLPIVLDPVMIAKSGDTLLLPEAIETLKTQLIPISTLITPNLPEAYALSSQLNNPEKLGKALLKLKSNAVLLKGGHGDGPDSNDWFFDQNGQQVCLPAKRIHSKNTHGTGCTLSAAICAYLAKGLPMLDACRQAKYYLFNAIQAAQQHSVGKGQGPVDHFWEMKSSGLN